MRHWTPEALSRMRSIPLVHLLTFEKRGGPCSEGGPRVPRVSSRAEGSRECAEGRFSGRQQSLFCSASVPQCLRTSGSLFSSVSVCYRLAEGSSGPSHPLPLPFVIGGMELFFLPVGLCIRPCHSIRLSEDGRLCPCVTWVGYAV